MDTMITETSIKFTQEEAGRLIELLHKATKAEGLYMNTAEDAVYFKKKLSDAFIPKPIETPTAAAAPPPNKTKTVLKNQERRG